MSANGLDLSSLEVGLFLIVKIDPDAYDQPVISGAERARRTMRTPKEAQARGAARENDLCWRVAEITELYEETPTDAFKIGVQYWETYDQHLDIAKRKYAAVYFNASNEEQYTNRFLKKSTPKSWIECRDTLEPSAVLIPRAFKLISQNRLPNSIIRELLPHISIRIVALPLQPDRQQPPRRELDVEEITAM